MLGVHFAVTAEQGQALLKAADDGELGGFLGDLEEEWADDALKVDSDKAWEAIDRCLSDHPLSHAVLGGRHLSEEYYAVYVTADEVSAVAVAMDGLDRAWLRERFDAVGGSGHRGARDDEDFDYTWTNFVDIQAFYARAAAAGRAVVFTAM